MAKNKMEENILNYGKRIRSLETFTEAVREMPGMYIGATGNHGYINMIREVYQNSIDELIRHQNGMSPCDCIHVTFSQIDYTCIIQDNGNGIPFDNIIRVFSKEHTSSNYDKKLYEYTSGRHGVGSKVTNALSKEFNVKSYILGEGREVKFIDGYPWDKGELKIPNKDNLQGTIVEFRPAYTKTDGSPLLGNVTVTVNDVLSLIQSIMPLTPLNSITVFKGIYPDGSELNENVRNEDGLLTYLIRKTDSPLIKPISLFKDDGTRRAEILFTYDARNLDSIEDISSYANFCPTENGTHNKGFLEGLCKFFRDYMNKIFLGKNSKISVIDNDIKTGLKAAVVVSHLKPTFGGQAKNELNNEDMEPFVCDLVMNGLDEWAKTNPKDLQRCCNYLKQVATARIKADKEKIKISNKYTSSQFNLPNKYTKPLGKTGLELFIVEGDSAAGSAKNERDKYRQGVFAIRGKLPNALTKKKKEFLDNEEIKALNAIISKNTYGKDFDMSKVIWDKIIFLPDADPDGDHIASLLLKYIMVYMPKLIEAGKIYKAVPPLYGIQKGKQMYYFTRRIDYVEYIQNNFSKNYSVCNSNGKPIKGKDLTQLFYINRDYFYELKLIADRYSIYPDLLEYMAFNINKDIKFLDKELKKKYQYVKFTKIEQSVQLECLAGDRINTIILNDFFIKELETIKNILKSNSTIDYILNGVPTSLFRLMEALDASTPKNIVRYKGLGEMNAEQLASSTMLDNENRVLIRYTMSSAKDEIEKIKFYESNKNELIKDIVATRTDLLG